VKRLKKSWKLLILFALVLLMTLGYVVRSRAFTLIELQPIYVPSFFFNSTLTGQVNVTNVSDVNLSVTAELVEDSGAVLHQFAAKTAVPGQTVSFSTKGLVPAGTTLSLRPVVEVSGGHNFNGAFVELLVFNANNQFIAALPAVQFGN
jgi:hypothetical protein